MIRRRIEHYETKTGHERWLVSYSDFITLLFGFFVVMYSVSQVSEQKYRTLSQTLASAFEGKVPVAMEDLRYQNKFPLDDQGAISGLSPEINLIDTDILADELQESLIHLVDTSKIKISASEEWVQIDVDANILFSSGSAEPSENARSIFKEVATILAPFDNAIEVSGHTDDVPINSPQYESNWELSSARASSVVRLLAGSGVNPVQMSAVGYGEYRPIADNLTESGRAQNRRVVLMVAKTPVERKELALQAWENQEVGAASETRSILEVDPPQQDTSSANKNPVVEPVRTRNGGLLFTSDPDSPLSNNSDN